VAKILHCERCRFNARDYHLVCALHPTGPTSDTCLDFEADSKPEGRCFIDLLGLLQRQTEIDQWEPEGASFYNGQLILQPRQCWTPEQQVELIKTHPMFTGICPACGAVFERDYRALVHWDCPCGWKDDSI
jgi:predicted RNA-binding Zn-ribbon protein involved in translation (DUF1610 family)